MCGIWVVFCLFSPLQGGDQGPKEAFYTSF